MESWGGLKVGSGSWIDGGSAFIGEGWGGSVTTFIGDGGDIDGGTKI